MRIIGGQYKGRRFDPPAHLGVRPTTDRAREALFNILTHRYGLEESVVLDGFAGSGAVGLEFLSRGAERVVAVDRNPAAARFIQQTVQQMKIGGMEVLAGEILTLLPRIQGPFDFVFFDPPYAMSDKYQLVDAVFRHHLLASDGTIILEHPVSEDYSELPGIVDRREYSLSVFSFFQQP